MDYIHLNPVRARLIRPRDGQSLLDYAWSSLAGGYALPPARRPKWLAAEEGLRAIECRDTVTGRRQMVERLDRRAVEEAMRSCGVPELPAEVDARCSHLRRGWYWGTQAFAARMRELAEKAAKARKRVSRAYRITPQERAHDLQQAEEWLAAGLEAAGLRPEELRATKGSDPRKLALADQLWRRTVVSQEWIAQKLAMRSAANVSQQLRKLDSKKLYQRLPTTLAKWLDRLEAEL